GLYRDFAGDSDFRRRASPDSIGEEIVGVERLCRCRDPFRTRRRAAFAAFVDRQAQRIDQDFHLVAGGSGWTGGPQTERILVEVVERGEAAWEEFAIDHAFGKTIDGAETELLGETIDAFPDQTAVARTQGRKPVADHHPIGQTAIDQAALAAGFADH